MRLNNRGVGLLPLVTGISVASVLTVAFISQMGLDTFKRSAAAFSEWETNLGNQKALSLGGYFVAHNLVLCREEGWEELRNKSKCRWGGDFHKPAIERKKFNVIDVGYEDGALLLTILNSDNDGSPSYETKLKMSLVNWTKDSALRSMLGEMPIHNALADDDSFMVLMSASTEMQMPDKRKKTVAKSGAVRRPISTPNISVRFNTGKESCIFECEAGSVLTHNPECRGPLDAPPGGGDAAIGVRITNLGPGAFYKLKYQRVTEFNQATYPGRTPEKAVVDVMSNQQVFMPGDSVDTEVARRCYPPVKAFTTQVVESGTAGAGSSSTTRVTVASTFRALSTEAFNIFVSKFDPEQIHEANFIKNYNPYDERTYRKNETGSVLEPRRLGTELPTVEVVSPEETITETTVIIRPRPVAVNNGDGDGDGDN